MRALFGSFRHRHGFVVGLFFCALLAAPFPPIAASAGAQENSAGKLADGEGALPSTASSPDDPAESAPRWTFSAEAILLQRLGGVNQTLVSRVPGSTPFFVQTPPFYDTATAPGVEAFDSDQFRPGFSAGPKISLTYHDDSGYGVELSYFNIFDWSDTKAIGPDDPADWLVMKAPGIFWQTQDFPYQAMVWKDAASLYSAEANGRLDLSRRVTVLAGLRWLQLNDSLQGTLAPADRAAPTWKQNCPGDNLFQVLQCAPAGGQAGSYPPFWNTSTTNNLFGVQVGVDGKILDFGRFSLDGVMKIGLFDNNAEQSTGVSLKKTVYPVSAATNRAAFASEAGLQAKYQLTKRLALRAGYEALWLDGVALAPGQIQETLTMANVSALGVNCRSNVLFQGATFGLEYSF
ncbi:MAG: BBP7 family outer membrane beta-barrel protein [Roseiarcus sp.]